MSHRHRRLPVEEQEVAAAETRRAARPAHLSWSAIGLVAAGGMVGSGLRYVISGVVPHWGGVPVATFGINGVGAFALGWLLELLAGRGGDAGWSRRIRLAVGTGVLGGFTTYSALATETVVTGLRHPWLGLAYGLGTVVVGAVASVAGIGMGRRRRRAMVEASAGGHS